MSGRWCGRTLPKRELRKRPLDFMFQVEHAFWRIWSSGFPTSAFTVELPRRQITLN